MGVSFFRIALTIAVLSGIIYPQSIELIAPNGGERWEANSIHAITWQASNITRIKIEYSFDGGYSWKIIEQSYDASTLKYNWETPDDETPNFLVRISDANNPDLFDESDKEFTVFITDKNERDRSLNKDSKVLSTPIKIMPLGDSITQGVGDDSSAGYRKYLYRKLVALGYNVDFVGSLTNGVGTDYDRNHEGHGGWGAYRETNPSTSLKDSLPKFLTQNPPDVIILHIGTNDLSDAGANFDTPASLADEVRDILNIIHNFNPDITVVLARIINRAPVDQRTTDYNIQLQQRADSLVALGRKIFVDNVESALNYVIDNDGPPYTGDMNSQLHPNDNGYRKMTFGYLRNVLPILQLKIFLQGPYAGAGLMSTDLTGIIPKTSPYGEAPKTVLYNIPGNITDWVMLEFRSTINGETLFSKSCFLRNDGMVLDPDGLSENISLSGINPGPYYIIVKHRNHLGVMSSSPVDLNGLNSYDFTAGQSKAYTTGPNPMTVLSDGRFGMLSGDGNGSGFVTASDNNVVWLPQNGGTGYFTGDYNLSGTVSAADNNLCWLANNGKASQIP
ncbi:MAG: SGNH/GDSL hydrolase family protein [Ignavibacteria bacterium]